VIGPKKQPPPSRIQQGQTAGGLARTWNWKWIALSAAVVVFLAWQFENRITTAFQNWWHSRAANPASAAQDETPPDTNANTRRSYEDMKEDTIAEAVKEEVAKVEQAKAEKEKIEKQEKAREEKKEKAAKKEPTLKELARDAEIGGKVTVAEALPDPDGESGGGSEFSGEGESQGVSRGVQRASFDRKGRMTDADGSEFAAGFECQINAGTPIQVQLLTAIDTARPGGQAIGKVVKHVYDTASGTCLGIPAGSTFYGDVAVTSVKNAKAAEVTFTSLTRPYPRNDTLSFPMSASDSMGRGGVNGRIQSNLGTNILLTAIATGVQLLPALVADDGGAASIGGAALGAFLGNAETPLNRAAREQLERPSTIELDPNNPGDRKDSVITVILRRHINADDFNSASAKPQGTNANQRRGRG
jgi:type IV secretory pathway VirB10-like protein